MTVSREKRTMICEEYINSNISRKEICDKYGINYETFKVWLNRYYPKETASRDHHSVKDKLLEGSEYADMTSKEMQLELIKKDIELARLKKKYALKINDMGKKEYVTFSKKTTK